MYVCVNPLGSLTSMYALTLVMPKSAVFGRLDRRHAAPAESRAIHLFKGHTRPLDTYTNISRTRRTDIVVHARTSRFAQNDAKCTPLGHKRYKSPDGRRDRRPAACARPRGRWGRGRRAAVASAAAAAPAALTAPLQQAAAAAHDGHVDVDDDHEKQREDKCADACGRGSGR